MGSDSSLDRRVSSTKESRAEAVHVSMRPGPCSSRRWSWASGPSRPSCSSSEAAEPRCMAPRGGAWLRARRHHAHRRLRRLALGAIGRRRTPGARGGAAGRGSQQTRPPPCRTVRPLTCCPRHGGCSCLWPVDRASDFGVAGPARHGSSSAMGSMSPRLDAELTHLRGGGSRHCGGWAGWICARTATCSSRRVRCRGRWRLRRDDMRHPPDWRIRRRSHHRGGWHRSRCCR